jgi:hypothetical protein
MINYWIVRQGKTYKDEIPGGYLWAPITNKSGNVMKIYSNLKLVKTGDIIFSMINLGKGQCIYAVGICVEEYSDCKNPLTHCKDDWITDGWKIKVDFTILSSHILIKDHIEKIRSLLPKKYSPLLPNGKAQQSGYLHLISEHLAQMIKELIGTQYIEIVSTDESVEDGIVGRTDIGSTVKEQLIKSRRGQGTYRSNLLLNELHCRITGVSDPSLLIASHIKPWRYCSDEEKLDGCNGLMLTPNADKLFDKGYISFSDSGNIIISSMTNPSTLLALGINPNANIGCFNKKQTVYLDYHRKHILRK